MDNKVLSTKERGFAIVLALFAVLILSLIGLGLLQAGLSGRVFAIRNAHKIKACCAADAGLTKAIFEMSEKLKVKPWSDSSLPQATDQTLPNCEAAFSYTVSPSEGTDYNIESIGSSRVTEKRVYAILRLQGPFEAALVVQGALVLKPGAVVDGYNFTEVGEKLQLGTLSTLPAKVVLGKGALVDGDVFVGVGADPDSVITAPQAAITGRTYALTEEFWQPEVTVPQWLLDSPSQDTISEPATITDSAKYDGINPGNGEIIVIDGPVTLYVTGNISLSNSAQIQINNANPNASLTLFLGGDLYCKNGGLINNLTQDPTRLKIFGLDSCNNISLATSSTFYGGIYACNAMMNLKSSVEIYGAVSVQSFMQGSAANFHYDAALKIVNPTDPCVRFTVKRWRE